MDMEQQQTEQSNIKKSHRKSSLIHSDIHSQSFKHQLRWQRQRWLETILCRYCYACGVLGWPFRSLVVTIPWKGQEQLVLLLVVEPTMHSHVGLAKYELGVVGTKNGQTPRWPNLLR